MTVVLEANSATKIYGTGERAIRAVDGISINVRAGEFAALVGPSGSGKTTLLAMMAGLLVPTEGCITIEGNDLCKLDDVQRSRFRRQKIGFTFQASNLVPYLTALENVELMLRLNNKLDKRGRERAREIAVRLGLGERLGNLPKQLSGGEQQRVAIARALVHNPSVVLADEPTANLDTERAFQVVEAFASLIHEQNRVGVMVTHDLRMCEHVDTIFQMIDGRLARSINDKREILALARSGRLKD
jgi:putative ABC transport system ATP-binding protein